jgi:hypothetical protein
MKFFFLAAFAALLFLPSNTFCQRDYFTPEEVEIIRDAQQMDQRINVLTHIIDRRFAALNVNVNAPAYKEKGQEWGQPPTGSRFELLHDIKEILQKAVDDIDNLSERPNSMVVEEPDPKDKDKNKKPKSFSDVFPVAVRSLAAAANRYGPALKVELDKTTLPEEKGAILDSLEICDEIIAAVHKLPGSTPADPKKGNQ